jgi:hypothetical protein
MDTTTTISALAPGWTLLKATLQEWRQRLQPAPPTPADHCAAVRALADSHRLTDPGFAADLYAAAARCEVQAEPGAALTRQPPR